MNIDMNNNNTGPQNKNKLSVLGVRHMVSNVVFTAEHEFKFKFRGKIAKQL